MSGFFVLFFLIMLMFSGCVTHNIDDKATRDVIIAKYAEKPVSIDGNLDDEIWRTAPSYKFSLSRASLLPLNKRIDQRPGIDKLTEQGEVKFAWNEKFLYIGAKLYDSDIVQESVKDQENHFLSGDVLEIFLKPKNSTWYWEIYGTPNEKKTILWLPGRGRLGLKNYCGTVMQTDDIIIATKIKGTLNNWQDKDEYWTIEMAIPSKILTCFGDSFGYNSEWTILIGRYNYSRYLPWVELSSIPQLSITHFHLTEEYGILKFEKP